MTEPLHAFTSGAVRLLGDMANKHRQRLPDVGRRTRRVSVPAQGCDCCDELASWDLITETVVGNSGVGAARMQFSIPVIRDEVFDFWFRPTGHHASPSYPYWHSDQFDVDYTGSPIKAHWELYGYPLINASAFLAMQLVRDNPYNSTSSPTAIAQYYTWGSFDYLSENKLTFYNRTQSAGEPIRSLPRYLCVSPVDASDLLSTPPLEQLWGATPPSTLNVTKNAGAPTVLSHVSSGLMDGYGSYTQACHVRPAFENGALLTDKITFCWNYFGSSNFERFYLADFAAPLDVSFLDSAGATWRVYE